MPPPTLGFMRRLAAMLCLFAYAVAAGSCANRTAVPQAVRPGDGQHSWQIVKGSATDLAARLPSDLVPVALSTLQTATAAGYDVVPIGPFNHTPHDAGAQFRASNRAHGFDVAFTADGISIASKPSGDVQPSALTMNLTGYGARGAVRPADAGAWQPDGSRVSRDVTTTSGTLREWYVNGPLGLEQGFTLTAPPSARAREVVIELTIGDAWSATHVSPDAIELRATTVRLRYGHLFAVDAAGRALPATITAENQQVALTVDVTGAAYPITVDPFIEQQKLLAPDAQVGDLFGFGLAIDGDTAVLGAVFDDVLLQNQGSVYVFTRTPAGWFFLQQLTGSDSRAEDLFGRGIELQGDTVLVGSSSQEVNGNARQGVVYHFVRSGGFFNEVQKITANDGAANHSFGAGLDLDGNTLVVGAPGSTATGSAYVFTRSAGRFFQTQKLVPGVASVRGFADGGVGVSADTIIIGAGSTSVNGVLQSGAAFVFIRPNGGAAFTETQTLTVNESGGLRFAEEVDVAGDTALVSLRLATVSGRTRQGAVFVFQRTGGGFTQTQRLIASDGATDDNFGGALQLDGPDAAYISAPIHDAQRGALYVFRRVGGSFVEQQKLTASDGGPGQQFGFPAASGSTLLVSAGGFNGNQGAAYIFEESQTLSPPTGLTASIAGQIVTLRWNAAPGALTYRLAAGTSPGLSNAFNANIGNTTTLVATAPNGVYFVRLHSVGLSGESGPSAEVTVVVGGVPPCTIPPPAPTFQPPTVAGSNVILAWSAAPGATSYAIEAGSQSGLANLANFSTGNTATSFTAVAVPRGTYFVRVRGQSLCGTGQASNERVVVVP